MVLRAIDKSLLGALSPGDLISQAYIGFTDLVWTAMNVGYSAAVLVAAVAISWWVARVVRNTEWLARGRIRSAWWSWVWFWVPGANLFRPVGIVGELWAVNEYGRDRVCSGSLTRGRAERGRLTRRPPLVSAWWLCVVVWVVLERVGEAMILYGPSGVMGLPTNPGVYIAMGGNAFGIAAAWLGIRVVRRVTALQDEWEARTPKRDERRAVPDRSLRVSPLRNEPAA